MSTMSTAVFGLTLVWLVLLAYEGLRHYDDAASRFFNWMAITAVAIVAYWLMLGVILSATEVDRPAVWLTTILVVVSTILTQAWLRAFALASSPAKMPPTISVAT